MTKFREILTHLKFDIFLQNLGFLLKKRFKNVKNVVKILVKVWKKQKNELKRKKTVIWRKSRKSGKIGVGADNFDSIEKRLLFSEYSSGDVWQYFAEISPTI